MFLDIRFIFIERELRGICSGKLLLDTEGVIIVQKMYNGRRQEYISGQGQPRSEQEAYHEIHKRRTLGHRRRIYDGELNRYQAAEIYDISEQTAWDYMRLYRDAEQLPPKRATKNTIKTPSFQTSPAGMEELESMTKEQLIQELVKARITEARLKKGYEVKGDGTVILYGNGNTK